MPAELDKLIKGDFPHSPLINNTTAIKRSRWNIVHLVLTRLTSWSNEFRMGGKEWWKEGGGAGGAGITGEEVGKGGQGKERQKKRGERTGWTLTGGDLIGVVHVPA